MTFLIFFNKKLRLLVDLTYAILHMLDKPLLLLYNDITKYIFPYFLSYMFFLTFAMMQRLVTFAARHGRNYIAVSSSRRIPNNNNLLRQFSFDCCNSYVPPDVTVSKDFQKVASLLSNDEHGPRKIYSDLNSIEFTTL